jgi:hypothetical protein
MATAQDRPYCDRRYNQRSILGSCCWVPAREASKFGAFRQLLRVLRRAAADGGGRRRTAARLQPPTFFVDRSFKVPKIDALEEDALEEDAPTR